MKPRILGIHHVTAISSSIQTNIDFYTGELGLRLVKQTVNYDAPEIYHFYYGNETGDPGSLLTFFPYTGLVAGRQGFGQVCTTSFSVPMKGLDYWMDRLESFSIPFKPPQERFAGEAVIYLEDEDGLGLELVFNEKDLRPGYRSGKVPEEFAIQGLYHVEIWQSGYGVNDPFLLQYLNHELVAEKGNRFRYAAVDRPGNYVDLVVTPDVLKGLAGSGTVHHLAFAISNEAELRSIQDRLMMQQFHPTLIQNRNYFKSVYFKAPGGVLFEIATVSPGFTKDEPLADLGHSLQLPQNFEWQRDLLEKKLPPIQIIS